MVAGVSVVTPHGGAGILLPLLMYIQDKISRPSMGVEQLNTYVLISTP